MREQHAFIFAALVAGAAVASADDPAGILNQPLGGDPAVQPSVAPPSPASSTPSVSAASPATTGSIGIAKALDGNVKDPSAIRAQVNDVIRQTLALENEGQLDQALAQLQAEVRSTNFQDLKARYFLAKAYELEARKLATSDPAQSAQDERMALLHLRAVLDLSHSSTLAEDKAWTEDARKILDARSASTPSLDQNTQGGSYPWGYCGVTALRDVLHMEGLDDPGPDAVALQGAHPYIPGSGSDGTLLAERAQQLGLGGATFTTQGDLTSILASVDRGRPVILAGSGPFTATISDGTIKSRSYPDGHYLVVTGSVRDANGKLTGIQLDDPDGGHKETMTVDAFHAFFGDDGTIWDVIYSR